jgi:hypothetical protein
MVAAMRVVAVNFHRASTPDVAERLMAALMALLKTWRVSTDTVVPFIVHGGVDVLVDVLDNVAHAYVTEDMARQCVTLFETYILQYISTMLLANEAWRAAVCVAKTASQFMATASIAKPSFVVLSTIFRISTRSGMKSWAPESSAMSKIGEVVVEAHKEYHNSRAIVGDDSKAMAWHAAMLMFNFVALARAADVLTVFRAPRLLLDVVSVAAREPVKPPSHVFLYCATLGRLLPNTRVDVPPTVRCQIAEAVLALIGRHCGTSLLLARAAVWALAKICDREATIATFVASNGVNTVTLALIDHAGRVSLNGMAAEEKKARAKFTSNVATLLERAATRINGDAERMQTGATGATDAQYDF